MLHLDCLPSLTPRQSNPGKLKPKQSSTSKTAKSKAKKQSKQSTESTKCFLLDEIAAEVRNSIWRKALVADRPLFADPGEPHQPDLLRTCKQVCDEASTIFFQENGFILPLYGYDSSFGLKWCNIAKPHLKGDWSRVDWSIDKSDSTWEKFLDWVRLAREGKLPRYKPDEKEER